MAKYIGQLLGWKKHGNNDRNGDYLLDLIILQEGNVSEMERYAGITLRVKPSFWKNYLKDRIKNYRGKVRVANKEGHDILEEFDFLDMTDEEKHPTFHYESLEKRIERLEKIVRDLETEHLHIGEKGEGIPS